MKRAIGFRLRASSLWLTPLCVSVMLSAGAVRLSVAQQPVGPPPVSPSPTVTVATASRSDVRYLVGPGDVLDIRVFNRPQLSREAARVDGRGMIRMPLVEEEIQAACRTEGELAREIANRYIKYQRNPQVFVFVKEYNSQPVAVLGAVEKPGRFQLQRRVRLLELVSFAGGPTDKAGKRVQVAHTGGSSYCTASGELARLDEALEDFEVYDLNEMLVGDFKSNPYVQPGDVVTIPEAEQVFVTGNVFKPSSIPLREPITVSQAVAMAGGTLPDSNLSRIRVIRRTPKAATKSELLVNLRAVNERRAEDLTLQAGDIIEVQTLSGKKLLRSLLGAVAPAVANLPIYVLR